MELKYSILIFVICFVSVKCESYEDKRCKCVCPSPAAVLNNTEGSHDIKFYIANVPPSMCNCNGVILPKVGDEIKGHEAEFCPRCDCRYENRNTTIIKVVVIIVIWLIMLLVIYMGFLMCLDPMLNRRKANYQEYTNDDEEPGFGTPSISPLSAVPLGVRGNVLNRVTQTQDKWKRQVQEQRRNIYDRHTILN